jgi:hypothetical protein
MAERRTRAHRLGRGQKPRAASAARVELGPEVRIRRVMTLLAVLTIDLLDLQPKVHRRITVPFDIRLDRLHLVIQEFADPSRFDGAGELFERSIGWQVGGGICAHRLNGARRSPRPLPWADAEHPRRGSVEADRSQLGDPDSGEAR